MEASSGGIGRIFAPGTGSRAPPWRSRCSAATTPFELERFEREGMLLSELHHPGIVRYVARGQTPDGERFLVMEWLEGEDLKQRLARSPLTPTESLTVLRNAAAALAVAHARGLVHRDIKPGNIFLAGGSVDRVYVVDFGVACLIYETDPLTLAGTLVGTPGYMAPEQARGLPIRSARTDVFSLGCVLFECLTGRRAFPGADVVAVLAKVQLQEPPSVRALRPDLPEALEKLVAGMMAREIDARFADAAVVVAAVEPLADFHGARAPALDRGSNSGAESSGSTADGRIPSLGTNEQRVVTVVLASSGAVPAAMRAQALATLEVERQGGHLDVLLSGVMLVTIWGAGSVVDRAARACRCALGLLLHFPDVSVCVATGRGVISARVVEGRVIDRAAQALHETRPGAVRLDATTAQMVEARFLVEEEGEARILRRERDSQQAEPVLLGKSTSFVGRSRELGLLEAELDGCVEERAAGAVLITGEAGSGKSRLARELLARIRRRSTPIEVLAGRADSLGERSPFGIAGDALRRAAGIDDAEPLEIRRQRLKARLGRHLAGASLSRVSAFLGEMAGCPFPDSTAPPLRAARTNAHLMGDAMRAAWEEWLGRECEVQPVLLMLEDLHWGDAATIKLVDATLRNLRDLPLLVVVLARPEIHARFTSLWAARGVREIKLGPLPRKASVELVCEALGKGAAVDIVARVVEHGNGNPFYLEELVRAVAAGRHDTFPDSVLGMVEARLDAEGLPSKRILRAASVFGERFSLRGVEALLGGDAAELEERVARLASRELILEPHATSRGGDALYTFCHALVREAVYATLTEEDRVLGHRLAGEWLEGTGSTDAVALAEHFVRGGEPGRAVRWYLRGAQQALTADDLAAAVDRVARGASCGASGEERGTLLLVQAEAEIWRGELTLGERCATEASTLFPAGSEGWFQASYQAVIAAGKLGHFDRVEASFASSTGGSTEGAAGIAARISYLCACASNLLFGGRYAAADSAFAALSPLRAPDALSTALIHQSRGFRASARGDSGACLECLTLALAAFEQAGDRRNATMTRVNLGFTRAELGELEGAEEALRGALLTADRMGLHDVAALARTNLGYVLGCRGQLDEARRLMRQAIDAHARQQAARDEGLARTYLAQIELRAGDPGAAEREARAAAAALVGAPSVRVCALGACARALLAQGRVPEALATASEAYAQLTALGSIEEGDAAVRLAYAEALMAAGGQAGELATVLTDARARLLARSAQISDLDWRARFLSRVPDNAATLAMAGAVLGAG